MGQPFYFKQGLPLDKVNKGIVYILISVATFAVINVMVKSLTAIPPHELIFFRSVISLVFSLVHIRILGLSPLGNNRKWLVIRGLAGITALTMFFYTLKNMPLASAVTIQYLSPVFTVILAVFLNRQTVKPVQWIFLGMAFVGAVLIKGWDDRVSFNMLLIGMLSALFAGLAYNAVIRCRKSDHPIVVVMYFPLIATPIMGVWTYFDGVMPVGKEWWLLFAIGTLTQIAQVYMTKALHADHASRITPFKYVGSLFALILGYTIFDERLQWFSLLGMGLVVLGVILNTRVKLKPLTEL